MTKPRLGFVGVGWIGRDRLIALVDGEAATPVVVADASPDVAASVAAEVRAEVASTDEVLRGDAELDGVVIATPSGLHAEQATHALRHGLAVFCQKPLARTAAECAAVVETARLADRLLAVDLSYRHTAAARAARDVVRSGSIGDIYATHLVFHNAYGPDKPWFRDVQLSGGGCAVDLGIHLIDLALWVLDDPKVEQVTSRLFAGGRPLGPDPQAVEDYAVARIDMATGVAVTLACSWNLPVGQDAVIEAAFYGTAGAVTIRNVDGSFYDFVAERNEGTQRTTLTRPPDAWGGRAIVSWAHQLAESPAFDPAADSLVSLSETLDRVYGR